MPRHSKELTEGIYMNIKLATNYGISTCRIDKKRSLLSESIRILDMKRTLAVKEEISALKKILFTPTSDDCTPHVC